MEKRKWDKALRIAKKARDKSIYNFIQWRHLLTKGNRASFYDTLPLTDTHGHPVDEHSDDHHEDKEHH